MTQRKPPRVSWESWVERQIREAQEAGEFDHLPGLGQPIPELDEPDDEMWWIKNLLKRERLSILPPALEILRVVEQGLHAIERLAREDDVRRAVAELNEKIDKANFAITWGPASSIGRLDVNDVLAEWRHKRTRASDKPPA